MKLPLQTGPPPVARSGYGRLEICKVAGQSAATAVTSSSPLKVLVPRSRGLSVWAYLSSFGGGMVAGDQTRLDVRVSAEARCFISTQASTKIYRNGEAKPCGHQVAAVLDAGSLLVLLPDPIQLFAGSSYAQEQRFHLNEGAGLVLVDWLSSGRSACGERWAFDRFSSRNELFAGGRRLLLDSLLLDSADGPLDGAHRMGRFNCFATLILTGPPVAQSAASVLAQISARPISRNSPLVISASPIENGALIRAAGESVEEVGREIHRLLDFLPGLLGDDPWTRKW